MSMRKFGVELPGWTPPVRPEIDSLSGRYMRLERLSEAHAHGLFRANATDDAIWDYLPYGPFVSEPAYIRWVKDMAALSDPCFFTVIDLETGRPGGVMALMRITPEAGSIELGHICLSPGLQGTRASSEAMMRLIGWAFEAGYRRFEWKCDALNLPSRRAAERLGLSFEGVFRQAAVVKGRNRDTAWFAAIDAEWPGLQAAYEAWLAPSNFDADGRQIERLSDLTRLVRAHSDPLLAERAG